VQWVFNNESNVAVYYHFTIFATEGWNTLDPFEGDGSGGNTYGSEGGKPKFGSDDDACDGATTIIDASTGITGTGFATSASITLPFDFTLFGVNSTNWFLCPYVGWFTNSASNCPGTDFSPSIGFPKSADYPDEQIFAPHWAEMEFGTAANDASTYDTDTGGPGLTAGRICMKQLAGTTVPNRIEIIEWRNMDLSTGVGDSLDFEMFLYEGTNEIDVYYPTMSKASGDTNDVADCTSKDFCRVGYQGSDIAGYSNGSTALSGDEKSSTNLTKSGKAYQFLPEP
jgi:hypothetical protein